MLTQIEGNLVVEEGVLVQAEVVVPNLMIRPEHKFLLQQFRLQMVRMRMYVVKLLLIKYLVL